MRLLPSQGVVKVEGGVAEGEYIFVFPPFLLSLPSRCRVCSIYVYSPFTI